MRVSTLAQCGGLRRWGGSPWARSAEKAVRLLLTLQNTRPTAAQIPRPQRTGLGTKSGGGIMPSLMPAPVFWVAKAGVREDSNTRTHQNTRRSTMPAYAEEPTLTVEVQSNCGASLVKSSLKGPTTQSCLQGPVRNCERGSLWAFRGTSEAPPPKSPRLRHLPGESQSVVNRD